MTTSELIAKWDLESDESVMTRFDSVKEQLAQDLELNEEGCTFYNYMIRRIRLIENKERQVKFEQQKQKETKHSVSIDVPKDMAVSHCPEHGWFASKVVYTRCYFGKEVKDINQGSSIAHWGARCPSGCFIIGGSDKPMTRIGELKTIKKSTVAVPQTL